MSARILVVDDVEVNVKLLEAKLSSEYFNVLTANDGQTALQIAQDERPDLILLDVMMPRMDGFETCKRLKADPRTAEIPVVMVTALTETADRVRGLEAAHAVGGFGQRGDHDHRNFGGARVGLETLAGLEAVHARQHDVEQNEVGTLVLRDLQGRLSVIRGEDVEVLARKLCFEQLDVHFDIVDDQDTRGHALNRSS